RLHFLITPLQSYTGGVHLSVYESATLFYDLMLGCVILLAIAFIVPAISEGSEKLKKISGPLMVFGVAVIFATPLSRPLWDNIGVLQEVQFPWRWLAISSAAAAVIAGAGLERTIEWFRNSR